MPYRRKKYKRRRGKKTTRAVAYRALRTAKRLQRAQEIKHWDTSIDQPNIGWTGADLGSLNIPPQGTGDEDRIGDQIFCKTLWLRHSVLRVDSTVTDFVRVIIIQDYRSTISNLGQVLQSNLNNANAIYSQYVFDKRKDYKVLWDKIVNISPGYRSAAYFTTKIKLNFKTQYNDGTTAIEKNRIKLFVLSDTDPVFDNKPAYFISARLLYYDA